MGLLIGKLRIRWPAKLLRMHFDFVAFMRIEANGWRAVFAPAATARAALTV